MPRRRLLLILSIFFLAALSAVVSTGSFAIGVDVAKTTSGAQTTAPTEAMFASASSNGNGPAGLDVDEQSEEASVPVVDPDPVAPASGLSIYGSHSCALLASANARCWGYGLRGAHPSDYRGGDAVDLATGSRHLCVLTEAGNVRCHGIDTDGETADYTEDDVRQLAVGGVNSCVLRTDGNVTCWGSDDRGVTDGYDGGDAVDLAVGGGHACVLTDEANVACWGWNFHGQAEGYNGSDAVEVEASSYVSCAVLASGNVTCWGYNGDGYDGGDAIDAATGGLWHSCALRVDQNVTCWGTDIRFDSGDVLALDAAASHTCVLVENATVRCDGTNNNGRADDFTPSTTIDDLHLEQTEAGWHVSGNATYGDLWEVGLATEGTDGMPRGMAESQGYALDKATIGQAAIGSEDLQMVLTVEDLESVEELRNGVRFAWDFAIETAGEDDGQDDSVFRIEGVVRDATDRSITYERSSFSLYGDCRSTVLGPQCEADLGSIDVDINTARDELSLYVPAQALRAVVGSLDGANLLPADVGGGITATPVAPIDDLADTGHGYQLDQDRGYVLPTRSVWVHLEEEGTTVASQPARLDGDAFEADIQATGHDASQLSLVVEACFGQNCASISTSP